jgi:hypothetical protein
MKSVVLGMGLLVALTPAGGVAMAAEAPSALFCETPPPPAAIAPRAHRTGPRWRDLEVVLVFSAGLAAAIGYVARNERRRGHDSTAGDWTPYLAGASLGLVFAGSLLVFGRPLGVSAGVQQAARLLESASGWGPATSSQAAWPLWVLVGVTIGGASSSFLRSRVGQLAPVPAQAAGRLTTWPGAFLAGLLLQIAATLAGGCTSGLALSGGIVLAPAAFVFMAGMFVGGIPSAWIASRWSHRGGTP